MPRRRRAGGREEGGVGSRAAAVRVSRGSACRGVGIGRGVCPAVWFGRARFFEREVGVEVDLGRLDVLVAEPERDYGDVDPGVQ